MTLLMALIYLIAGVTCIHRPERLTKWMANALKRTEDGKILQWIRGRGILFFIRLIGFLAMLNSVMLFYTALYGGSRI